MNQEIAQQELLAYLFLREISSVIASGNTYADAHEALVDYLGEVRLHGHRADFDTTARFPDKRILSLLLQPHTLGSSFRAWLRKHGIDPDRLALRDKAKRGKK